MRKHTEKQPIDDLFARKLGNLSLPPSSGGFERLQARMEQNKQETRIVFWRNPDVHRYMAIAACLVLVCLFGWLYWPSTDATSPGKTQVAVTSKPAGVSTNDRTERSSSQETVAGTNESRVAAEEQAAPEPVKPEIYTEQLAKAETPVKTSGKAERSLSKPAVRSPRSADEPALAQAKAAEINIKPEAAPVHQGNPATTPALEQLASKPLPTTERVLIVTIAEPEALVAARQAAKTVEEKPSLSSEDKPEKETRAGNIWQQVKRIKQGEVFARHDNGDDDRGLLGRAYNGLKHSLDKDKPAKQ